MVTNSVTGRQDSQTLSGSSIPSCGRGICGDNQLLLLYMKQSNFVALALKNFHHSLCVFNRVHCTLAKYCMFITFHLSCTIQYCNYYNRLILTRLTLINNNIYSTIFYTAKLIAFYMIIRAFNNFEVRK